MKKTILKISMIACTLGIYMGCSKSEDPNASGGTCAWGKSYLAGKSYQTTKVAKGTGSTRDSLEQFSKYTFTADSLTVEYYLRTPILKSTIPYTAVTNGGINYLQSGSSNIKIDNFSCTGFMHSTQGNEPFELTFTKL